MALKGIGIDKNGYTVANYYTPDTYTTPPLSVGDYFTPQGYVNADYVVESLDLVSTFTVSAQGTLEIATASLISTFTLQADADKFDLASATITSSITVSVEGGLLQSAQSSLTSSTTQSAGANITFDVGKNITASSATTQQANVSYSAVPSIGSTLSLISVGGVKFDPLEEGEQDDYTWDSFAESDVIDRTWNEWFGNK